MQNEAGHLSNDTPQHGACWGIANGTLANVGDKDHFWMNCIVARSYTVTVSPRVVGVVYVDGVGVNLDANGRGTFSGLGRIGGRVLVGITGGTGNYTITVR